MLTVAQRQAWRGMAILTFCFATLTGFSFVTGALINLNTPTYSAAQHQKSITLFQDVTPHQYPLLMLLLIFINLPFLMAPMIVVVRTRVLVAENRFLFLSTNYLFGFGAFVIGLLIILSNFMVVFTESQAETRLWLRLSVMCIYGFVWCIAFHLLIFGIYQYRIKLFPRWLALSSIGLAILTGVINSLSPNIDFPHFMLTLALPIMALEPLVWGIVLFLIASTSEKTTVL